VRSDVSVDNNALLLTNFVNLKIKSAQSFSGAPRSRMCVHIFIRVSNRICMSTYVCTVFLKKNAYKIVIFTFYVPFLATGVIVILSLSSIVWCIETVVHH
jgi:hypothetical protein